MSTETILTVNPEDEHSFDDYEMQQALSEAVEAACSEDGEAFHFLYLEDGRMISGLRVEKETLSDGSVVCAIYLKVS